MSINISGKRFLKYSEYFEKITNNYDFRTIFPKYLKYFDYYYIVPNTGIAIHNNQKIDLKKNIIKKNKLEKVEYILKIFLYLFLPILKII